ncbi:Nucleotide-binding, alpha-beta plait [Metarhizium guizhouense ARSEF 977]|uniref:Nucleotide-binding, alpha-beta plait n=1 Tax=Metarhizium guizhouense (strain ARSEF 977) TaxID=1276136 RepID=A0A0B4GIY6_METGA|nr:Nucleotide-binding, alpha-beta plait [Metarhizium guizhouense ARSEF 977]
MWHTVVLLEFFFFYAARGTIHLYWLSGRGPKSVSAERSYCTNNRDSADLALGSLSATIGGRRLKVGRCEPKKQRNRDRNHDLGDLYPGLQRWGDWATQSSNGGTAAGRFDANEMKQAPHGAMNHFEDMLESYEGRRLYVGGLGKMIDQPQHTREITELFSDYPPAAIGKRITPHQTTRLRPGNHHYCFVDFKTREQATAAMTALDGRVVAGGKLKVELAGSLPNKLMKHQARCQPETLPY